MNREFWGRWIGRLSRRARAFMRLSCTMRKYHRTPESPLPPLRAVRTPARLPALSSPARNEHCSPWTYRISPDIGRSAQKDGTMGCGRAAVARQVTLVPVLATPLAAGNGAVTSEIGGVGINRTAREKKSRDNGWLKILRGSMICHVEDSWAGQSDLHD